MSIDHIAIWARDIEVLKAFYLEYLDLTASDLYHNPKKNFSSYFLSFESGARIELMTRPDINQISTSEQTLGYAHFAISLDSKERVDSLTETIREAGYKIAGEPRTTGDGYYESVIEDPEGNLIELTV